VAATVPPRLQPGTRKGTTSLRQLAAVAALMAISGIAGWPLGSGAAYLIDEYIVHDGKQPEARRSLLPAPARQRRWHPRQDPRA
jgi:hypothetical protein